jgi:MFS family permease
LRGPRLWRGPRRRDALPHARLRRRQPPRLRLDLDRIGSLATLLLGATLQAVALALFLPFDGLVSLYVVSAVFGLFQGGIVPSYAIIVRESFPAEQAGFRVGLVLSSTLIGMAIGGWMSGAIFDATGSYQAAVLNGLAWNALTMAIALWLILRSRPVFRAPKARPIWQA